MEKLSRSRKDFKTAKHDFLNIFSADMNRYQVKKILNREKDWNANASKYLLTTKYVSITLLYPGKTSCAPCPAGSFMAFPGDLALAFVHMACSQL